MTEHIAVSRFREYLRIKTVQPDPDYASCMLFLKKMADELDLQFTQTECSPGKPIAILTWKGSNPSLKSIILNSHTDVVPVFREKWNYDPFGAEKTLPDGKIFARGSQDMKCVGIQYLEAIRILKQNGIKSLPRTFHCTFVPDEEIGGQTGMKLFVNTEEFDALNVEFALDEGIANPGSGYKVFYGERAPWWIRLIAEGPTGHGSQLYENTATVRLNAVINKLLTFREHERLRLATGKKSDGRKLTLGDVTTVNLTVLKANEIASQYNVIPQRAEAGFDIRISPLVDMAHFKTLLDTWCGEQNVKWEIVASHHDQSMTPLTDANPFWKVLSTHAKSKNVELIPEIFPAATDSRFLRAKGLWALGVSPIQNTPILLHDHDEFLKEETFLEGLEFYTGLIEKLGNVL